MGMTNSDWKQAYNLVCKDRDTTRLERDNALDRIRELEAQLADARECNEVEQYARLMKRIQQLEAELQVRDNMGNEVLRILREAMGRRDFHSEMEAAEHCGGRGRRRDERAT